MTPEFADGFAYAIARYGQAIESGGNGYTLAQALQMLSGMRRGLNPPQNIDTNYGKLVPWETQLVAYQKRFRVFLPELPQEKLARVEAEVNDNGGHKPLRRRRGRPPKNEYRLGETDGGN